MVSTIYSSTVLSYNFDALYVNILTFYCYIHLSLLYIFWVTSYFAYSDYSVLIGKFLLTCYQSHSAVGGTLSETKEWLSIGAKVVQFYI